jgi:hypothetical protein
LIGNSTNHNLVDDLERMWAVWWAQRLLWFARDEDIVVLAAPPQAEFLAYVTGLTGTDHSSLRFVTPPAGVEGTCRLTPDRLADQVFRDDLVALIAGRRVESIFALWPDPAVADLACAIRAQDALAGYGFVSQGGGALVNSKAIFRAVAAGAGIPLPQGTVCMGRPDTEDAITAMIRQGHPVIVKSDFGSGAVGNRIVSPEAGLRPLGAPTVTIATDRAGVRSFLDAEWNTLTSHGRYWLVVERYHPESRPVFAEFLISDEGPQLGAHGEMVMAPVASAQVIPAPGFAPAVLRRLVKDGRRLCDPLHAMGYRGLLSADAIVTPEGALLFTEYNGRVTGSTHIYKIIGEDIVGKGYAADRLILERVGWKVPSFESAQRKLASAGIGYDRDSRSGVILNTAFSGGDVWYCVVAESLTEIQKYEDLVAQLFTDR